MQLKGESSITVQELREHPEYSVCMDKIKSYRKGFKFTMYWNRIPEAKANGLKIILADAVLQGLIKKVATGFLLDMTVTDETFVRL